MENPDLVLQETGDSSPSHSRWLNVIADKLTRLGQTRQNRQNGSGGTNPKWTCFCHLAQQQTASTYTTSARPPIWTVMQSVCHGRIWTLMPSHRCPSWASGGKAAGLPMQENHSDWSKVAQHAWFWDLVTMSSQIPVYLPNLHTQPFNQTPHRNLLNLDLNAWFIESQQLGSWASLRQWQ